MEENTSKSDLTDFEPVEAVRNSLLERVEILDAVAEGKSLARVNNMVIFVSHAVPGDIADIRILKKKKNYLEGIPEKFHKYSEHRANPVCEHFGVCGGCKWQNLQYSSQLIFKQKQVVNDLQRIGKLELPEINPIIASSSTFFYRNKLDFTFSNHRWLYPGELGRDIMNAQMNALGFHIPGRYDRVLDIRFCHLQPAPSNEIRLTIKEYALKNRLTFFDLKKQDGFLRNIIIRISNTGEIMLIFSFFHEDKQERVKLLEYVAGIFPEITSLMYVINPKGNDTFNDLDVFLYKGKAYITEEMEGLRYMIGPKSFFQTNSSQAYRLYRVARDFAGLTGGETVYDLYSGIGSIACFIASSSGKVIGVESVNDAVEDAKRNSEINGNDNTSFFSGNAEDILNYGFFDMNGKPDVVLTDPPRVGMHAKVVKALLSSGARKIVYVSCNPATQSRDVALLGEKYRITGVQPVDMFPHTHHVENVILLELR
jgi:23S rRNA (uracil1939-C5)-methyltransferase